MEIKSRRFAEYVLDPRVLIHYGLGTLCIVLALWYFAAKTWSNFVPEPPKQLGEHAETNPAAPWYLTVRGPAAFFALGVALLVTGSRSDSEKRGYNF